MEIHELDNTIKRALLCKVDEIRPSEETLIQILEGLEKQQASSALAIRYKHYMIALICAVSIIFGTTLIVSVGARASAMVITNTVKSVFILDNNNKVSERIADEVLMKHAISDNTQPGNVDIINNMGVGALFLHTFAGCFLLNQVYDLKLCLRLLAIGRMTVRQAWYSNKFRYEQVLLY